NLETSTPQTPRSSGRLRSSRRLQKVGPSLKFTASRRKRFCENPTEICWPSNDASRKPSQSRKQSSKWWELRATVGLARAADRRRVHRVPSAPDRCSCTRSSADRSREHMRSRYEKRCRSDL